MRYNNIMKYDKLIICGLPKSFDVWDSVEYIDPTPLEHRVEDIKYDAYPLEVEDDKGEDGIVVFKYNESASGVYAVHNTITQTLALELSPWAVEADVLLYASYVNAVLAKHKRARLFDHFAPLPGISEDAISAMVSDRKKYLKRLLAKDECFVMEGLNSSFSLYPSHLRPAPSADMQVLELQNRFVKMQWEFEEE